MKLFRNCEPEDFMLQDGCIYVVPKQFKGNADSTAKPGTKSFWFSEPLTFTTSTVLVEAEIESFNQSQMSFTLNYDDEIIERTEHVVDEFTTTDLIKVKKIYIDENSIDLESMFNDYFFNLAVLDGEMQEWTLNNQGRYPSSAGIDRLKKMGIDIEIVNFSDFKSVRAAGKVTTAWR